MKMLLTLARRHPWSSLGMLLCLLLAGLAEGVGTAALVPLFQVLGGAAPGSTDPANRLLEAMNRIFDAVGVAPTPFGIGAVVVAGWWGKGLLTLLARRQLGYTVARIMSELRLRMVRAILRSHWRFFIRQKIGTFSNAYSMEAKRAGKAFMDATLLVALVIQGLVQFTIALLASWQVTLVAVLGAGPGIFLLSRLVRSGRRAGAKQTRLFASMSQLLTDILQGVKPIKAMSREYLVEPMLDRGTRGLEKAMRKEVLSRETLDSLQEPILLPVIVIGLVAGPATFGIDRATFGVIAFMIWRVFQAINKTQSNYQKMVIEESAYWSLIQTTETAERAEETLHAGNPPTLERAIELRSVAFAYDDTPIFESLSLTFPAGEIIALSGPSGAGKTSIVDLISGLVEPDSGEILIDGVSLSKLDVAAWRRRVGYVPQEMFLLHDSIAQNVGLGDPEIPRAEIERALRDAHAWEFVARLPEGIDTQVGERGSALSGGQRQRIAIARAIVHRPWLLILDEATAALDPESERLVWQAVASLRGRTTVVAISHQRPLLDVADRHYRIDAGRAQLVEAGSPSD
jgi:ATP-binding cassette subfamily C protein